jgi:uncharacterized protein
MLRIVAKFTTLPILLKVILYIGSSYFLIFLLQFITGFLPIKGNNLFFHAAFCLLALLLTKYVLQLEGMSWKDIGLTWMIRKDNTDLFFGTITGIIMLVATAFIIKWITGFHWELNPSFRLSELTSIIITIFISAFIQELFYRGYAFKIMWDKWGEWPAQLIIALLFGIMHLDGNMSITDILLTMLTTGIGSLLFGIAVIKTNRLHLAVGIHFGWNLMQHLLPRATIQNGSGIWNVAGGTMDHFNYLTWILPYMTIGLIAFIVIKKRKHVITAGY